MFSTDRLTSPRALRWLWIIAAASLALNGLTLALALIVRGLLSDVLPQSNHLLYSALARLEQAEPYPLPVHLREQVQLSSDDSVLFEDVLAVPVDLVVPVSQTIPFRDTISVPINQTVRVEQTVRAPLDINGTRIFIDVPVVLDVPVRLNVAVPIDIQAPVQMSIPLQTTLNVPVRQLIPLRNSDGEPLRIGLDMRTTVPVPLDALLEDVELLPALHALHKTLNLIEALLVLPLPK